MNQESTEAPRPDSQSSSSTSNPASPKGRPAESEMTPQQLDAYQRLRQRVKTWLGRFGPHGRHAQVALLAPDFFHLLCRILADPRVLTVQKAKLAATITYFVVPVGLVPELITGPIGYIDDVALAAYVLNGMLNSEDGYIVREHWAGEEDVLNVVQGVLDVVDNAIGHGFWNRISGVRLRSPFGKGFSTRAKTK